MIRQANLEDVARMLEIYAPYVAETAISFEYTVPTLEAFRTRFLGIAEKYPWIVWEDDGRIIGFAYASTAFERAAYRWDADVSIYVDREARHRGVGTGLYDCLESMLRRMGYCNLYALITADNLPSCRFHEKRGYVQEGLLRRTGYKFGRWYDVKWYCLNFPENDPSKGVPPRFEAWMLEN